MNGQPSLFDVEVGFVPQSAFSRRTDPETSREAAQKVDANALEALVLKALQEHGSGGTTEEIADWLHMSLVTVSPRLRPLEMKALVRRDGVRANRSGRSATVWKVA